MTVGNPTKLILKLSLPLILTNLGQQFYMIVDAAIVGRGVGVKALASVGASDWIYWLFLWAIAGFTQGFSVFISRYFGDKNFSKLNKTLAMSVIICAITSVIFTVVGLCATKPLLLLLKTPSDIIGGAVTYLITMLSGIPIVMAYNMSASILRAMGDGKTPLVAMIIAALLNIGLDLLFVLIFGWGIFGAAFASVLSQAVSFIYCFTRIKKIDCIHLKKDMWKPDTSMITEMLKLALPISFQYIIISAGGIVLQSTINEQGSVFVAGFTATNKLYGLLESMGISFGSAFATFFAQNYGAGKKDRVRKGVGIGILFCAVSSLFITVIVLFFGNNMLQLFLDVGEADGTKALAIGHRYLIIMSWFLFVLYLIHIFRNLLQSMGLSFWPMVSGLAEFGARVGMSKLVILWVGVDILFYAEPTAWFVALVSVAIPYLFLKKKYLYR